MTRGKSVRRRRPSAREPCRRHPILEGLLSRAPLKRRDAAWERISVEAWKRLGDGDRLRRGLFLAHLRFYASTLLRFPIGHLVICNAD